MNARVAIPLVIGVTSHRNLVASEVEPIRQCVRDFLVRMQREHPDMPMVVVSALAEGGDQLIAEEALAVGARLIAALPMTRAEYAKDFVDAGARARFEHLCDAGATIDVSSLPGIRIKSRADAPEGEDRDRHYAQVGVYVSDHCHVLLAVWDGKPLSPLGGTGQIADYHLTGTAPARTERRRDASRPLLGTGGDRLAYHVVCARDQEDGSPALPLESLQTWWRTGDRTLPGNGPMPDAFRATLAHTAAFNVDARKYAAEIDRHADLSTADRTANPIDRLFKAADWLAIHFQRRVLLSMRTLYTLAALMGIAFAAYDNLPSQDGMLYVFLALFAIGGYIVVLARRRGWHRKYLDYRALAEGLRVQSYWRRAGIALTSDAEFARDNFLQKQDVELGWVRNAMRTAGLQGALHASDEPTRDLHAVIAEWVGDGESGGQLEYYRRKAAQRARMHRFTEAIGLASLCVGIGISVALAVLARYLSPDGKNALVMTMAVFSIIAGVRSAYAYKKADKELIKQYRYMQRIFNEARIALDRPAGVDEKRDILRQLGEAALAEQVEWALMHRQRPLEQHRL